MALLIGASLALAVGLFSTAATLDRDRAFYALVMMVVASYYVLFAVMGASTHVIILESLAGAVFISLAVLGFRWSLWLVVAALVAHGLFDFIHDMFVENAGVPLWWPDFCLTYDITAAAYLASLLKSGRIRAAA